MSSWRNTTRNLLKSILRRAGLLLPAFRVYELATAMRGSRSDHSVLPDGLPLPPARLRVAVVGSADREWFIESGRQEADLVQDVLGAADVRIDDGRAILDFGCGCGRVLRHWQGLPVRVYGTDYNPQLIAWCTENLGFADCRVNNLAPPLDYPDEFFDLVYTISILTHIPERLQRPWIEELRRIVKPGGHLILTTQGDWYASHKLTREEAARFHRGEIVVREEDAAGTNLCAVFHPKSYVRERLASELVEVSFRPGRGETFSQDLYLLRKPRGGRQSHVRR